MSAIISTIILRLQALFSAFAVVCFIASNAYAQDVEKGIATYYGHKFNGRKTASGILLDNHDFVAAHKTLPFGTKVKVTALWNGKSTIVKIIDRGPYPKGRIIDLSHAAAKEIGLLAKGVGKVSVEVVN